VTYITDRASRPCTCAQSGPGPAATGRRCSCLRCVAPVPTLGSGYGSTLDGARASTPGIRLQCVTDVGGLPSAARAWNRLAVEYPNLLPFNSYAGFSAYVEYCLASGESWACAFAWCGEESGGVLPITLNRSRRLGVSVTLVSQPRDCRTRTATPMRVPAVRQRSTRSSKLRTSRWRPTSCCRSVRSCGRHLRRPSRRFCRARHAWWGVRWRGRWRSEEACAIGLDLGTLRRPAINCADNRRLHRCDTGVKVTSRGDSPR